LDFDVPEETDGGQLRNRREKNLTLYFGSILSNTMTPSDKNTFADRLKSLMEAAEMSQADLVKSGVISKSYLSEILSGKHPPPDVSIIKGFCRALRAAKTIENELILLAGKEFEHILANEAAADFLRKTVENGWGEEEWQRHNQLVDIALPQKKKIPDFD
jgi:transcriptional regulator with XRE-family HTH domain